MSRAAPQTGAASAAPVRGNLIYVRGDGFRFREDGLHEWLPVDTRTAHLHFGETACNLARAFGAARVDR